MNNTPGNAQRQGAEPRRASTLNAISNPKPHFHCKHSNFWFTFGVSMAHIRHVDRKNRPFGMQGCRQDRTPQFPLRQDSVFRELYHKLNKDTRKDFIDFLLSEVESTYWREILKQII